MSMGETILWLFDFSFLNQWNKRFCECSLKTGCFVCVYRKGFSKVSKTVSWKTISVTMMLKLTQALQVLFYFFKSPCYGIHSFYYIFKYCLMNTSIAALCACLLSFATNLLDSKLVHFSLLTSRCQKRAVWLWRVYRRTGVIPSSVCLLRMLGTSREREQLKQKLANIYFCVWQLLRLKSIITYVCL